MPTISERGQNIPSSPIRELLPYAYDAEARGVKILGVNIGNSDQDVPEEYFSAVMQGNRKIPYAPSPGTKEHLAALLKYYKRFQVDLEPDNIIPTQGGSEAIFMALLAAAHFGDEVLIFEPTYPSYISMAIMLGITLVPITLKIADRFALPANEEIESKITPRTKAIIVVNPDNPTGRVWSKQELLRVLEIAKKYDIFVIADETYREILFNGEASSLLALEAYRKYLIVVDSASKRFSAMGARVGWIVSFDQAVMDTALKIAQARLSVGTSELRGLIPLLEDSKRHTDIVRDVFWRRRNVVNPGLSGMQDVVCVEPQGAFYHYAQLPVHSAKEFAKFLLRHFSYRGETVWVAPAKGFWITPGMGERDIRIANVLEEEELKRAVDLVDRGLRIFCGH